MARETRDLRAKSCEKITEKVDQRSEHKGDLVCRMCPSSYKSASSEFTSGVYVGRGGVISDSTKNIRKSPSEISARAKNMSWETLSRPSLWWAAEQFDPFGGRLVENWLADAQVQQINLVVNWQLWTLLDYLGRYRFVNQFGTVARKYGYSLNIFNQKQQCLATYKYNNLSNPPKWEINLDQLGKNSLQVEPSNY